LIYGIGIDVIQPQRVARLLEKYGSRFVGRVLTPVEQQRYAATKQQVLYLANRFAAKEAFSKAMGTGFKPGFAFSEPLAALVRQRGITGHHLTISDESNLACACVVLET